MIQARPIGRGDDASTIAEDATMIKQKAIGQVLAEFSPPAMDHEHRREMDSLLLLANLRRGRALSYVVLFVFALLLAYQLLAWERTEELMGAKATGLAVMRSVWLVWALVTCWLTSRLPESAAAVRPRHHLFEVAASMTTLLIAALHCGLGYVPFTGITVYLVALFIIVAFMRYNAAKGLIVFLPGCFALVAALLGAHNGQPGVFWLAVNGITMTVLALAVGRMLYASAAHAHQQMEVIQRQKQDLQELDRVKSQLLSSVSHELRTPLTSVIGFTKIIRRDFMNTFAPLAQGDATAQKRAQRIAANLDIIATEGERLTRLINDVLDLTKIESGHAEWRDQFCAVGELVRQAAQAVSGEFTNRPEVSLDVQVETPLPPLMVDRDRLVQVMINLLNNASKFTVQGRVSIRALATPEGKVRVEVSDTGPGIPQESLGQIFDQFYQVIKGDTLSDKPKGTGLGLSICKQIIEHYNGRIWAKSVLGQGSVFTFELPPAPPAQ
jgi:signal transduction histidine kinase